MKRVLFVCTGNICRSSMAEGLLREAVQIDGELSGKVTAASAGVSAFDGDPASENSQRVMMDNWNIDISGHRSRMLSKGEVEKSDLILTMTKRHKNSILSRYPGAEEKVFTLKEYVKGEEEVFQKVTDKYSFIEDTGDIFDPYGLPYQVYKRCGEEIKEAIDKLIIILKSQN